MSFLLHAIAGKTSRVRLLVLLLGVTLAATDGLAQSSTTSNDWQDLTLEQLVNVQVTSVSKKQTDLFKSPAAIYVITQEDIRRSGLTSIPELLRMVPGLDVARIDATHWAITARGFNNQFGNKLLVLIDGRTVYTPEFGGVYWNVQDMPLEDLDRIEVIRGPGATLWGANAVNGVINIITKSAKDTQGGLLSVTYGTEDQPSATVRYGGKIGTNLFYRGYVKYFNREGFENTSGAAENDADATRGGLRLDWEASDINRLTLQGDYYKSDASETFDEALLTPPFVNTATFTKPDDGGNILGHWTHDFSETSQLTLQMYYDYLEQGDAPITVRDDTYDVDLQHRFALGDRQDIVWGLGYRYQYEAVTTNFFVSLTPPVTHQTILSAFVQDEITVVQDRLHLTIGSKFEHNDFTGFEIEPSARLAWTPTEKQTVWAAISRAVRTPTSVDLSILNNRSASQPPLSPPILISVVGNPNFKSEELLAYELGYRVEPTKQVSFDVAAFYNVYNRLEEFVQGTPQFVGTPLPPHLVIPLVAGNNQQGETYGAEFLTEWQATAHWKWTASYTLLQMHISPNTPGTSINNDSPQNQFQIRSYLDLPHNVELNGAVYYVDQVSPIFGLGEKSIPAYVRLDLGLTWRPTKSLEIGVWGQNLLDGQHPEFTSENSSVITEIPRSVVGKITWHF
jgi:iron complex outermembrane receptor protein